MDDDGKKFANPFPEVREKKFVTLDVASEISGYTKTYLDRLCRLNQVEHLLWSKGGFVIELDSLLRATHTILASPDGISFVNDKELVPLPPEDLAPQESSASSDEGATGGGNEIPMSKVSDRSDPSSTPLAPSALAQSDEWDALLLGGAGEIKEEPQKEKPKEPSAVLPPPPSAYETPSPYRPIQTSTDSSLHHDPSPLLPPLREKETPAPLPTASPAAVNTPATSAPAPVTPKVPAIPATTIPTIAPEHHPAIPETHSIMKNSSANIFGQKQNPLT